MREEGKEDYEWRGEGKAEEGQGAENIKNCKNDYFSPPGGHFSSQLAPRGVKNKYFYNFFKIANLTKPDSLT